MNKNAQTTYNLCSNSKEAILYVLRYFAIFQYPLLAEEVHGNASFKCSLQEIEANLDELCALGRVYDYKGFYSTNENIISLVERRLKANQLANIKIKNAVKAGKIIATFPFVRFVGISGSLSKGYADEKTDFDFFIVTSKHKLWLCRTILHLFKKITFPFGQEHKFCMNYFIDISRISIEENNMYTAIELSSLIPVSGKGTYKLLMEQNHNWIINFLPNNYNKFFKEENVPKGNNLLKSFFEILLYAFGDLFNLPLMKLTDNRWRKKWRKKNYPEQDYNLAFKTTLYHSKNHPANYQKKILEHLNQNE